MPGIGTLINAVSADLVARLAAANYPPLTDGRILIGRQHVLEQSSPPRIVFVPLTSTFGPRAMYGQSNKANGTAEQTAQIAQRSIATDTVRFEVHVWGQGSPPDPEAGDFDAAQLLYQALIMSVHTLTVGSYRLLNGAWADQTPTSAQLQKAGHEFVFGIEVDTPVLDQLLPFVPSGVVGQVTVTEVTQSGSSGSVVVTG